MWCSDRLLSNRCRMEYKKISETSRINACLIYALLFIIYAFTLVFTVYAAVKIYQLETQLKSAQKIATDHLKIGQLQLKMEQLQLQMNDIFLPFDELIDDDKETTPDDAYDYYDTLNSLMVDDDDGEGDDVDDDKLIDVNEHHKIIDDIPIHLKHGGDYTKIGSTRSKRNVLAETMDGVLINSQSYSDNKNQNKSNERTAAPITQTGFHSPAWVAAESKQTSLRHYDDMETQSAAQTPALETTTKSTMLARKSRVMHVEDKSKAFKQVVKKSMLKSAGRNYQDQSSSPEMSVVRDRNRMSQNPRTRKGQRLVETMDEQQFIPAQKGKRRPVSGIHFNGDTSSYVVGVHTNFKGEGHLRHAQKTYVDWKTNYWVEFLNMDQHFKMEKGYLTFRESGVYFIYAQIYYLDPHDMNGYRVYRNEDSVLQCTTMTHSADKLKGNTCYTAGMEYFAEGDTLSIRDLSDERWSLFLPGNSFFGVIKFIDTQLK